MIEQKSKCSFGIESSQRCIILLQGTTNSRVTIMTEEELERFEMLSKGPCITSSYVSDFYGLSWPLSTDAMKDYEAWVSRMKRQHKCADGWISRYELESF